jgi:hypothetical protein
METALEPISIQDPTQLESFLVINPVIASVLSDVGIQEISLRQSNLLSPNFPPAEVLEIRTDRGALQYYLRSSAALAADTGTEQREEELKNGQDLLAITVRLGTHRQDENTRQCSSDVIDHAISYLKALGNTSRRDTPETV